MGKINSWLSPIVYLLKYFLRFERTNGEIICVENLTDFNHIAQAYWGSVAPILRDLLSNSPQQSNNRYTSLALMNEPSVTVGFSLRTRH